MVDLVEEWKKRDPYFQDVEGFQKFIEQKENELQVQVGVSLSLQTGFGSDGYEIWLEIPYDQIPEEYKSETYEEQEQKVQNLIDKLTIALRNIGFRKLPISAYFDNVEKKEAMKSSGLRPGSTTVFRKKDGKWYYYGDESHCGEENIRHNAKFLWKVWKTAGSLVPNCFGVGKPYQCDDIYLRIEGKNSVRFPPFYVLRGNLEYIMKDIDSYHHKVYLCETEEPSEPLWENIAVLSKAILSTPIPNTDDPFEADFVWALPENQPLPILRIWRKTIPEVKNYLAKGNEIWDPENSIDIMRNGGLEILHPYLRRYRILAWNPEEVVWDPGAAELHDLYYKKFSREELLQLKVAELWKICKAKTLTVVRRKSDMMDAVLEANFNIVEEVTPEEDVFDYQGLF